MTEILYVRSIELDLVDEHGTSSWISVAEIADMVQTIPATYHPADLAHPAEYGPAVCSACFELEDGELPPPIDGSQPEQIQFLDQLDLDWVPDDPDCIEF
tara:strand:+ start:9069 stop:9368 length:300 start_codon:yes stop_codon:yes gene_type:complete